LNVNGQTLANLAKISAAVRCVLVHYSADYGFNGQKEQGCLETDQPEPINVYGASKALGEKLLTNSDTAFYLIRTAWLYGPNGKNFVDTIIDLSKQEKRIKIVNDQFGSPTFTEDLAQATYDLLTAKKPFGIYHLTNSGVASWYDLVRQLKEIMLLPCEFEPVSSNEYQRPAKRPKYSVLLNQKTPGLRSWQEALKSYLETKKLTK